MNMEVEYLGGSKFAARTRTHAIVSDQPRENGGSDAGMTPPELLLAALGTCAGYYATQYLRTRHLSEDGVRVSVSAEKATLPARIGSFKVTVTIPAALDARQFSGVERAVHSCLIHNTLVQPPAIAIAVNAGASDSLVLCGEGSRQT